MASGGPGKPGPYGSEGGLAEDGSKEMEDTGAD